MNRKHVFVPLAAAVAAVAAAAGTASAAPVGPAAAHGCPYGAICLWPGPNFTGGRSDYYWCGPFPLNLVGPISYENNQTRGTVATFTFAGGATATSTAYQANAGFGTKRSIVRLVPCS